MRRVASILVVVLLALLAVSWPAGSFGAGPHAPASEPLAPQAGAPSVVSYQGQVAVGGSPYTGDGAFKFAIVDALGETNYWANDGTASGEPHDAVTLPVTGGLFSVLLGEAMTELPASAFEGTDRYLRVWFSSDGQPFVQLIPDRRIAAVPYALQAVAAGNAEMLGGAQASAYQLRVSEVCEGGSMISAINADGTVLCGGMPEEHTVRVGSANLTSPPLNIALVSFSLAATHVCDPDGGACLPTTYQFTMVHEFDDSSPLFAKWMAKGEVLPNFALFVEHPVTTLAYLELGADSVRVTSVATATERRPGASPLETITLSFELDAPVWNTAGGPVPAPEDFPLQARVGTLTLGTEVTVPVFGHEWSAKADTVSPSFSSLIVTTLLDGSAPQMQRWLDEAAIQPNGQLDLFTPGTTDVMATYQLKGVAITGAEQWASGVAGELAFNKVTLDYLEIRETVGTTVFCWDLVTNSECN